MNFALRLFLALIAVASGSCAQSSPTGQMPAVVNAPFSLSISAPQMIIKAGNDVHVTIVLTNTSSHNIPFEIRGRFPYLVEVHNATTGSRATPTAKGARDAATDPELDIPNSTFISIVKPGQTRTTDCVVNQFYDLSVPGKYAVQVQRNGVKSNVVTISITP